MHATEKEALAQDAAALARRIRGVPATPAVEDLERAIAGDAFRAAIDEMEYQFRGFLESPDRGDAR